MIKSAILSECGQYRYYLSRNWGHGKSVCFIMLNPSTADASEDDPTIRRCVGYAKDWGYKGIEVINLFAYRATSPSDMKSAVDPIGPDNMKHLFATCSSYTSDVAVCAWGTHGGFMGQDKAVIEMLSATRVKLNALKITKAGHPSHPLYLSKKLCPAPYPPKGGCQCP